MSKKESQPKYIAWEKHCHKKDWKITPKNINMIINFRSKKTKRLFETDEYVPEFNQIKKIAKRKLLMLHEASSLKDLILFPNNHLEKLVGDRLNQMSIRINDQYRVCFI